MKISVVQMEILDGAPEVNRTAVLGYLQEQPSSDLYIVPELWTSGYEQAKWAELAEQDTPFTVSWMAEIAAKRKIWLAGSVIASNSDGTLANRFMLFNRSGQLVCEYDKAHLFRPLQEDKYLRAGDVIPPVINVEGLRVSPAICYDLRFPEMFRRIALQGVDVFLISSEWPYPRQHSMRVLAEARAIENQAVVALANRVGSDSHNNHFCGGSGIFGPLGPIAAARPGKGVVTAYVDIDELRKLRESFPVLNHRIQDIDYE